MTTAEAVEREGYYWWPQVLGFDNSNPYWTVYVGAADGFSGTPASWSVPEGGAAVLGL